MLSAQTWLRRVFGAWLRRVIGIWLRRAIGAWLRRVIGIWLKLVIGPWLRRVLVSGIDIDRYVCDTRKKKKKTQNIICVMRALIIFNLIRYNTIII